MLIEHVAEAGKVFEPLENSFELTKRRGHVTLRDEEYERLAENAAQDVEQFCSDLSQWHLFSNSNGIEIYERKSSFPEASESMLLSVVDLPCSMEKLEELLLPWGPYRQQWDSMLEDAEHIYSWSEKEVHLVRHLVKKMFPMSARESLDVVKILRSPQEVVFGCCSTTHAKYPPTKTHVRTHQYIGGYVFRPNKFQPGHTKFLMLFHADLNLPGPKLFSSMASKFKPKFMVQKIENLKMGIQKFA